MDDRVVAAVAALVAYVLWRRGVVQGAWNALFSGGSERTIGNVQGWASQLLTNAAATTPAPATNPGATPAPSPGSSPITGDTPPASGASSDADVFARIPQGLSATIAQYGNDLYNWCLAFVNKTRQAAGRAIGPYGAGTAIAACNQLHLLPGVAPTGATVCFSGGPSGHIGIANGGDSYTSAGLIHGGLTTRSYLQNPAYMGYAL
jgi:hypothetical protein